MNNGHVTYNQAQHEQLSISCNIFVIVMEYETVYHSPAIVVVVGRPVHRMNSTACSHLKYKIYTHVLCLKLLPVPASRLAYW